MALTVNVQDELPIGVVTKQFELVVQTEHITVRELIRQRVHREVSLYNLSTPGYFQGLVQPTNAEATLNGYKLRQRRAIDWEEQAEAALGAFEQNGFFVLVDDRQTEALDEVITIDENTQISFVKLIGLVGG